MALKKKQDKTNENKTQVLIVDDHPVVRDGLTTYAARLTMLPKLLKPLLN
jgi:hypothetical protein